MKKLIQGVCAFLCIFTVCSVAVTYAGIWHARKESAADALKQNTPAPTAKEDNLTPTPKEDAPTPTPQEATPTPTLREDAPTPTPTLREDAPTPTPKEDNPADVRTEEGIDLYGTYDQNDLLIQNLVETRNGTEIIIPKIEGLKDGAIQEKVNQDIYGRVQELLKGYPSVTYADYYVRANFANVISIDYYIGDGSNYGQIYLNYNLVDGEQLKLEDLFLKDADVTQIIRSAFYNMLVLEGQYGYPGEEDYVPVVSPDENELYKIVKSYLGSEVQAFAFSPAEIYFYHNNSTASVRMVDIAESVSVYSKYRTEESLYTRDDIGYKNVFTCADTQYSAFKKIEYGYLEPNFWYDITVWNNYMDSEFTGEKAEKFAAFEAGIYAAVYEKIEDCQELAGNHPETFYILLAKPMVSPYSLSGYDGQDWKYIYSNAASVNENIEIYEMPMELYDSVYRDKLIDTYRYVYFAMRGGAYLETPENDGAVLTEFKDAKAYNYISGEELLTLEDVFYPDSGYMEVIKEKTAEVLMTGYDYSGDEAQALADSLTCSLRGTNIYVTIPSLGDFWLWVSFSEFEKSTMKIFD